MCLFAFGELIEVNIIHSLKVSRLVIDNQYLPMTLA